MLCWGRNKVPRQTLSVEAVRDPRLSRLLRGGNSRRHAVPRCLYRGCGPSVTDLMTRWRSDTRRQALDCRQILRMMHVFPCQKIKHDFLECLEYSLATKWLRGLCKSLIYMPAFDAVLCIQPCERRRATPVRDYSSGAAAAPRPPLPQPAGE